MHNARPFIRVAGYFTLLFSLFASLPGKSQNLVPNNSFETFTTCPTAYEGLCFGFAPPWVCASLGSSDLFNSCGNPSMTGVPDNAVGTQPARTGSGYAGFLCRWPTITHYREYCMVQLTAPMVAGTWYYVSFYVSLSETSCGVEHIGAYFSPNSIFQSNWATILVEPQVESNTGFLSDMVNWTLVSGCFQATGGESYITIGNFELDDDNPLDPNCNSGAYAYYYLEDVSVTAGLPPEEIPLDLGDEVFECFSYEIDPDHDGPFFEWNDGSTGPTLSVTETGVYTLTVTDGCNQGIDSVEVTIGGSNPPVDLGPDEVSICTGDEYTINLDPDLFDYEWNDGSNDPEYTITTTGTYSVTLDDGCVATTDEIEILVLDPPSPFDLGDDEVYLCTGDEIEFSFDPDLGDFLWQDGNTSSDYTIDIGGEYILTISNICGSETDDIIVVELDVPEVEIGPDVQTLCEGDILEIEIDEDLGEILWNDGSSEPNYEISNPGVYTVFVTNQCGVGSDQVTVSVIDPPAVNLGPDLILCENEVLVLSTSPSIGNYIWQDNSTSDTLLVTSPGIYALSITNFCGTASDQVLIDYTSLVTPPGFGPDVNLCPGEQIILHANNPGANYLWQDLSTADSLIVTSSGTYTLQVSNTCNQESDTIVVTVDDSPPQVNLLDQVLCQGETITLDASIGGVTYLWNDNSQNQQLVVSTPGAYSLTVSNSCGMDVDTAIILDGGPAPFVDLGNDVDLCPGDMVTLTPINSDVTSWLWQDGSTSNNFVVTTGGMVTVQVTNACSSNADTMLVNLLPATPPLDLGVDTSLCSGESFTLSINTPGVTILWPNGSTGNTYNINGPGQVYAAISNSCGQSFDTIQVVALPDVPALNLGVDQSLCPGELITLNPGISNVNYLWQDGSTNNTYQTTQEVTVILSISNECGVSTDTVEIIESTQGPQVNLGPDIQVCAGEIVTILSGIAGVNYTWQDGSTASDYITTQSGTFILQVNNNCGTDSDTLLVDISGVPPTPALGSDTTLCEGIILNLISTADQETTIAWQNGSSSSTFNVSAAGTYILSESNRCGDAADTLVVAYLDKPDPFSLGPDTTLCPGEFITLTAPTTAFAIEWQNGSNQLTILADLANTYSLQLSNECGTVSDNIQIDFDNLVPQLNLDPTIPWCQGDIITLDATQPFIANYSWSTGAASPSIIVNAIGQYSVDVTTPCSIVSQDVEVVPGDDCIVPEFHKDIYVPNVFSPNGDGINDEFRLSFGSDLQVLSMDGTIYDRWGNLAYHSDAINFVWDGNFAEESVMPGVYVYTVKVKYTDGNAEREEVLAGDVTLLR